MTLDSGSTILITGGAGFIGSALVRHLIRETTVRVVNVDCMTYAGNLASLSDAAWSDRYAHHAIDIQDLTSLRRVFALHSPDAVVHMAAESHVDRSISGPDAFVRTNCDGTHSGFIIQAKLIKSQITHVRPKWSLIPCMGKIGLWV